MLNRWLDYVTNFGHLLQWNLTQYHNLFAKVGSIFSNYLISPQKIVRLLKFRQSGEISPNLVPLNVFSIRWIDRYKSNVTSSNADFQVRRQPVRSIVPRTSAPCTAQWTRETSSWRRKKEQDVRRWVEHVGKGSDPSVNASKWFRLKNRIIC